jgi:hypothetical protein
MTQRVFFFEKITSKSILFCPLLKRLGFEIYYRFHESEIEDKIKTLNLNSVDYLVYPMYGLSQYYLTLDWTEQIIKENFVKDSFTIQVSRKLGLVDRNYEKLLIGLRKSIYSDISPVTMNLDFFDKLPGSEKVYCWVKPNWWAKNSGVIRGRKFVNLYLKVFFYLSFLLKRRHKQVVPLARDPKKSSLPKCNFSHRDQEVLYFPHRGIFYSNLFQKDFFYSSNETSSFHQKNVHHISIGHDFPDESLQFFHENRFIYSDVSDHVKEGGLQALKEFVRSFWGQILIQMFKPRGVSLTYTLLLNFYSIWRFKKMLLKFPSVKIVIFGYDSQIPINLSLACRALDIETVACQERLVINFCPNSFLVIDHYFTQGQVSNQWIEKVDSRFSIENCYPVGPVRSGRFQERRVETQRDQLKVLVLDVLPPKNDYENKHVLMRNWEAILGFYREVLVLAKKYPSINFVIKGKNLANLNVPAYKEFYQITESMANLRFSRSEGEIDPFLAASEIDLCLAIHTSFGDELLSIGIPVLFYDFFSYPACVFDYDGVEIIFKQANEIFYRFDLLEKRRDVFSPEEWIKISNILTGPQTNCAEQFDRYKNQLENVIRERRKRD